jgi:hypothetical protein
MEEPCFGKLETAVNKKNMKTNSLQLEERKAALEKHRINQHWHY